MLIGNGGCNGTETVFARNNIVIGGVDFLQPFERSCYIYSECTGVTVDQDSSVLFSLKNPSGFPTGSRDLFTDPLLQSVNPEAFDAHLRAGSPARDTGLSTFGDGGIPAVDFAGTARPQGSGVDRDALEQ